MVLDLLYLPNTAYFTCLKAKETVQIEVNSNYQKQSYRNRCLILNSQKVESISIPVNKLSHNTVFKEVTIDYSQAWQRQHLGAIKAAYGKAAFFEFYFEYFQKIINQKHAFLLDLNWELLSLCLKFLKINTKLVFTENYQKEHSEDMRDAFHPKKEIRTEAFYQAKAYNQVFGQKFVNNLSIVDLIMCEGPNALSILEQGSIENEHIF